MTELHRQQPVHSAPAHPPRTVSRTDAEQPRRAKARVIPQLPPLHLHSPSKRAQPVHNVRTTIPATKPSEKHPEVVAAPKSEHAPQAVEKISPTTISLLDASERGHSTDADASPRDGTVQQHAAERQRTEAPYDSVAAQDVAQEVLPVTAESVLPAIPLAADEPAGDISDVTPAPVDDNVDSDPVTANADNASNIAETDGDHKKTLPSLDDTVPATSLGGVAEHENTESGETQPESEECSDMDYTVAVTDSLSAIPPDTDIIFVIDSDVTTPTASTPVEIIDEQQEHEQEQPSTEVVLSPTKSKRAPSLPDLANHLHLPADLVHTIVSRADFDKLATKFRSVAEAPASSPERRRSLFDLLSHLSLEKIGRAPTVSTPGMAPQS